MIPCYSSGGCLQRSVIFVVAVYVLVAQKSFGRYHHVVLDSDNRFHLYWTLDSQKSKIIFRVEVETRGYVGLGISARGGMQGSDIALGWIKDGHVHLQDRHAFKNELPILDVHQDWDLLGGYENDTHTVLRFQRKLDTCDQQDFPISNDTARIIYAYHDEDPVNEEGFSYHGRSTRGTKSVMLLQPHVPSVNPALVQHWDFRLPNITIPDDVDTTYWCKIVKAPTLNKRHHVIKISPLISKHNVPFVHHMVLYRCLGGTARELEPHVHHSGHPCYVPNMPQTYAKCESVYAAWGIGADDMIMPERAGLPLGDKANIYFLLEIHYDNGNFHSGIVDQSGFRLHYTPSLRAHDAMTLMVGASVDPCIVIPPGQKQYVVAGHADPQCLDPEIPPEGIKLFAVFLHSHLLGKKIKLRHFRGNTELPLIASDLNYDFNYQEYRYLPEEVTVIRGDHLTVECTYDSTKRNRTTFGGLGTGEEMCLAFILYYPRINRARALSSPTCELVKSLAGMEIREPNLEEDSNYTFYQHFHTKDRWDANYIDIAQAAMQFGYHRGQCYFGDGLRIKMNNFVTYPPNVQPYKEATRCSQLTFAEQRMTDGLASGVMKTPVLHLLPVLLSVLFH